MDGIVMMHPEQKPEWYHKREIFYEDQMETLNAERIREHVKNENPNPNTMSMSHVCYCKTRKYLGHNLHERWPFIKN